MPQQRCWLSPIFLPDHADPGYLIAAHFADHHESSLLLGFDNDTTEHLARMVNEASDMTLIDPLHIIARSENYLNDWTR